jgi:hypothetical protein
VSVAVSGALVRIAQLPLMQFAARASVALALVVAGCDDPPSTPSDSSLVGAYVLEAVDDGPLPDSVRIFVVFPVKFLAETLIVADDSTYLVSASVRDVSDTISIGFGGTVRVRGDSVFLAYGPAEAGAGTQVPAGLEVRAMSPSVFDGRRLRYRKVSTIVSQQRGLTRIEIE